MPPLALSFDLDGTLLDASHVGKTVADTCSAIADRQPTLDASQLADANSRVWEEYFPEIEDGWALGLIDDATVGREAWRRTLEACGSSDPSLVEFARHTFARLEYDRHQLYGDVLPVITGLHARGVPAALVTNGSSTAQRRKLEAVDLEGLFEIVIVSGEIGVMKPDPRVFEAVLNTFHVDPDQVWHVGDWLPSDVAGANAAGLTSVWLNRPRRPRRADEPVPHLEITSLNDLDAHL